MKSYSKLILLACATLIAVLGVGCTHMGKVQPNIAPVVHGTTKIPANVALVLDRELDGFQYKFNMMGDTWQYPFGPALKDYARNVTSGLFENVSVVSSPAEVSGKTVNLIMRVKGVKAEQTMPSTAFELRKFTLVVQWTVRDGADAKDIWIKTLSGYAEEPGGNIFTGETHEKLMFQKLFDDLTKKTVDAMTQSPELARGGK
ncbi:MAG: hypothetical protein NTY01_01580 [Verrucomicrobia bacterium]|nr:hypothetical protein [Verrucomicrobiota bacterium]